MNNKLIVILGPTASGKTDLSVKLAKKYNGEIVSADSRQIYRGLNIGSGKITKKEMQGIPHYLLDVASPKQKFTVAHYQKLALAAIKKIQRRGKLPFLVGGSGFYIQSVVDGIVIPAVKPNWKLRQQLEQKSAEELFLMLQKLDPMRAKNIDSKNPRRLVRAIEIVKATGQPVPQHDRSQRYSVENGRTLLQIGIKKSSPELKLLIAKRLQKRLKAMIAEVKKLHADGLSFKRLEEFGLEYRFVARLLQGSGGQANYEKTIQSIQKESEHFAKRQMTWFKRDRRIHWISSQKEAKSLVKKFL